MYPNGNPGKVPIVLTRPLTRFSLTRLQPSKSIVINRQEKQSLSIKVVSVTHAVFNRKNAFDIRKYLVHRYDPKPDDTVEVVEISETEINETEENDYVPER